MTQREQEILEILKNEPTISQQDLAKRLGITRSSVAVHITNLLKKGYLLGKGYVVSDEPYVLVIGGSNVDITGFSFQPLIRHDSNVGSVKISLGGVGRNIAENCARLGLKTRLISVIGDDLYGQKILKEAQSIGLNTSDCLILRGEATSTYLCILDETKDMALAINHMESIEKMSVDFILSKRALIERAQVCVLDTNLPQEVLDVLLTQFKDTVFFVDTVSTTKAIKIKQHLKAIHTLKPNRLEALVLCDLQTDASIDDRALAQKLTQLGVQQVFVSHGSEGVYYADSNHSQHRHALKVEVINATGAGDAFMAGLVYAYLKRESMDEACMTAMAASALALTHEDTINPNLSETTLLTTKKEIQHV